MFQLKSHPAKGWLFVSNYLYPHSFVLKKISGLFIFLVAFTAGAAAQMHFSVTTDVSLLRNLTKDQQFTTVGQSITGNFHITPKATLYAGISYYVNGRYKNRLTAGEKDTAGGSGDISYTASSRLGYRQFSLGAKHFFAGAFDNEESLNIYGTAGFGVLAGNVENVLDKALDTAVYVLPQRAVAGTGRFHRLTFDLGLGAEFPIAAGFFVYGELRTWLPASNYPSPLLYNNRTPRVLLLNAGVRILFN